MNAIQFKEQTGTLSKPSGMAEECGVLPIHFTGRQYVSCWKMNFKERIKALLFGRVWLYVWSQASQPPVSLVCKKSVFKKREHGF